MRNSMFKNENSLDNYSLIRYHMYADAFGAVCTVEINIKSLWTNVQTDSKMVAGRIGELIAEPNKIYPHMQPGGRFAWFLEMILKMAQYDYAMNPINWEEMYDATRP